MTLLKIEQLTLQHGLRILYDQLCINLEEGDSLGLLGPNGCGKTTLLHALAGLHPVKQGDIYLREKKLSAHSSKQIAQEIGILFQDFPTHFSQTVWEYCLTSRFPHLSYFKKESDIDKHLIRDALKTMDLYSHRASPISALSGGEKRRLALAALLAQTPNIYLLDEPTNHLDVRHQISVLTHFHSMTKKGKALIMALHDVNLAYLFCNKILLLFACGDVLQGTAYEVLTESNLSRLYQHPMIQIKNEGSAPYFRPLIYP